MGLLSIRILVVEDSVSLLRLYRHVLTRAGYTVLEASTGSAALEIINRELPDILLLDRVLPDMDGSEICALVKRNPAHAEAYVIMLSGQMTSEDDRASGLEAGADDYVVKPVGKRELLARVQVAVRLRQAQRELRASERKFRTLAENSPDYITRIDRNGAILYLNPAANRLLRTGQLLPQAQADLAPEHLYTSDRLIVQIQTVFQTGRGCRIKSQFQRHDHTLHLDTQLVPEFNANGEVESILAVTRDYTDFVQAEQEIRRLATVIQQAVDAVLIADAHGHIVYANAAYESLTGLGAAAVMGRQLPGYTHTCLDHGECRLLDHLAGGQERWQGLIARQLTDNEYHEFDTTVFAIHNRDGEIINYAAIQRDVTERRRSEREREVILSVAAALRRTTTRREILDVTLDQIMALMHVVSVACARIDDDSADSGNSGNEVVIECVRGMDTLPPNARYSITGTPAETVIKHRIPYVENDTIDNEADPASPDRTSQGLKTAPVPDARAVAAVPLIFGDQVVGLLWIGSTIVISERMLNLLRSLADMLASSLQRAELYEATQRYAEELEQRVAERTQELADANEQLRELDRLKSKFVSNVSHELRTPISNFKLYLDLLRQGNQAKRPHYETILEQSADRLSQLVQDILSLSRLEIAHFQPREFSATDLNAVISQVVTHFAPQAEAAGLHLEFVPDPNLPLIIGDYNQLSQLVTNLLSNALNYTPRGSVTLKTMRGGAPTDVHLIIRDTGTGILTEDLPHVFDRFYRGSHSTKLDIPGTGLGLAIVKEIMDIHQGKIDLSSVVGEGTTVHVSLPVERHQESPLADVNYEIRAKHAKQS